MALAATVEWDLKPTGNDTNGGGFNAVRGGSDYSLTTAPQQAYTDLVIQATNTQLGSATRPFVAADAGNLINITAGTGFTTGRYEIVSVAGGIATMDRAVGTANSVNGSGRLGGCLVGVQTALSAMVDGNTLWISGTYGPGLSNLTVGGAAARTAYKKYYGYGVAHGDGVRATLIGNGAANGFFNLQASYGVIRNLVINGNGSLQGCTSQGFWYFENCKFLNATNGFQAGSYGNVFRRCEFQGKAGGNGYANASSSGPKPNFFEHCTFSDGGVGLAGNDGTVHCTNCLFVNNTSHGVTGMTWGCQFINCTFANNGGSGFATLSAGNLDGLYFKNCLFALNSRYALEDVSATTQDVVASLMNNVGNAFYSNTLGKRSAGWGAGTGEIDVTVNPFNNSATRDYGLNNTALGGALLRKLTTYSTFNDGVNLDYVDVGAVNGSGVIPTPAATTTARTLFRELTDEQDTGVLTDAQIDTYIQAGMEALNRRVKFNVRDDQNTVLVAGTAEYTLPTDFVEPIFVELNSARLDRMDYDEWRRRMKDFRANTNDVPTNYAIYGRTLIFFPAPSAGAIADDPKPLLRYVATPRDYSTYGPEQLPSQDYRIPIYWGVAEFSANHPDGPLADQRAKDNYDKFEQEAARILKQQEDRKVSK